MNESELMDWNLNQLWNFITDLETEESKEWKNEIETIKSGINIKVPIQYFIEGYYKEHPQSQKTTITGFGKYSITTVWEELDQRKKLMRSIAKEFMDDDPTTDR